LKLGWSILLMQGHIARRGELLVTFASTINVNDFKTGVTVEIDGTPYRVIGKSPADAYGCQPTAAHPV